MINIFCTHKLATFLPAEQRSLESYTESNNWNAQLFAVERRKCILFIKKHSFYSFIIVDILKKDIKNLNSLFLEEFVNQLKIDGLYESRFDKYLKENYSQISIYKTDSDQSTLGVIRDRMSHINYYLEIRPHKLLSAKTELRSTLNLSPVGQSNFKYPKKMILEELNSQF